MSHKHAFYIKESKPLAPGTNWKLHETDKEVLKHIKALRIKAGESLIFIFGDGHFYICELVDFNAGEFKSIRTEKATAPMPGINIFLSPPNNNDLERAVHACVELGVSKILLFQSDHCVNSKINRPRLLRIVQSACEQSMNAYPPDLIELNLNLEEVLQNYSLCSSNTVFFDEIANETKSQHNADEPINVLIGPEGGWSEAERKLVLDHGLLPHSLGPLVLKVPTAIVSAITFLRYNNV